MAARGEPAPKTWPIGEKAAERIKEEQERLAAGIEDEGIVIDELYWKQCVTDLQRVMDTSKQLWLSYEQSNEPCIRVAMEIMMDRTTKKVLWWPDYWFSDHDKREYFKSIVNQKLMIAIATAKGSAVDFSAMEKDEGDAELVAALRRQIAELEAALRAARAAQAAAEARCRELEEEMAEARRRLKEMENDMNNLRKEGRTAPVEVVKQTDNPNQQAEIDRLNKLLKEKDDKIAALENEIAKLKKQLDGKGEPQQVVKGKSDDSGELEAAKKRIEQLEKELAKAKKEIAALKAQLAGKKVPVEKGVVAPTDDGALDDLRAQLEAERRRVAELEEELRKEREKYALLQKELDLEKKRFADLQAEMNRLLAGQQAYKPPTVAKETVVETVIEKGGLTDEQLAALAELDSLRAQVEKLLAKLKKRDQQIASLQEENEKLNEDLMKTMKMLKQVREQLRIVMELAEKKGLGDIIKKLFEEAGLGDTMADPEYTCFDRLYDDALRRMDKQRRLEWFRLGNKGDPPPDFYKRSKGYNGVNRSPSPHGRSHDGRGGATAGGTGGTDGAGGGQPLYCKNCGFPVSGGGNSHGPASRVSSFSPEPQMQSYPEADLRGREQRGREQPAYASRQQPQSRSQSPSHSAHGMDMRIEVVKHSGGVALAVASFQTEDPWDRMRSGGGQMRQMQGGGGMNQMSRSAANFRRPQGGEISQAQLQTYQLDPINGGAGAKARSRSPPERGAGGPRMPKSAPGQRGNLPKLPADMASPTHARQRLVSSHSAAELRHAEAGPTGVRPGQMRGSMLVEHPRSMRHDFPGPEDFAPKMFWRPQKVSADLGRMQKEPQVYTSAADFTLA